jgi:hypothetical protein
MFTRPEFLNNILPERLGKGEKGKSMGGGLSLLKEGKAVSRSESEAHHHHSSLKAWF